ncbi:MAG TPA: alkaline phosphatase family protein [Candidatus Lokiarchaeia archaeon]|nr:alkaline phosphatase family protein [Candidatus Lokiarchaeia archaeon]
MDLVGTIVFPRPSNYNVMLIILDGLADVPIESLDNKTPLEYARKPNLDALVKRGQAGLVWPYLPWAPLGSGPAHLALLGYDPLQNYIGRGPLEALGEGVETDEGDVIIRLNFATIDPSTMNVLDRRAGRLETEDAAMLFQYLNDTMEHDWNGMSWRLHATKGYRGVITIKNASSFIDGSDPRANPQGLEKVRVIQPMKNDDLTRKTADFMNWFIETSQQLLQDHPFNVERESKGLLPANQLLSRGAGTIKYPTPFAERYQFKSPAFVSGFPLYQGLARFLGIENIVPDEETIPLKFAKAAEVYKDHDITILHIKDPDVAGEDGDVDGKVKIIEEIDKSLKCVLDVLNENDTIVITADHATPAKIKDHSGHPVPILARGPFTGHDGDLITGFNEKACAKGSLGNFRSIYLMNLILMLTLRLKTFGA